MKDLSIIPGHAIAGWLQRMIDDVLRPVGLEENHHIEQLLYIVIVFAVSVLTGLILRKFLLWMAHSRARVRESRSGAMLLQMRTLTKCSHVVTPLVFLAFVPFAFDRDSVLQTIVLRAALIYAVVAFSYGLSAVLAYVFRRIDEKANTRNLPVDGVLNLTTGVVWLIAVIISVSIAVDRSPAYLLTGLTAFAAVVMLVFKDTILGFVAGIQMVQNDMLHVGDWIVVPDTQANGTMEYVSLSTVKVRNFDNTIITVPPYTLVSKSFQNWRGMSDSGVRRICCELLIAPKSVAGATEDMVTKYEESHPVLKQFAAGLREGRHEVCEGGASPWNGSMLTNLGMYRAYLVGYLLHNEHISPNPNLMVNIADPKPGGLPLQVYCFVNTTDWVAYEGVKSGVLEHAVVTAREFGLEIINVYPVTG